MIEEIRNETLARKMLGENQYLSIRESGFKSCLEMLGGKEVCFSDKIGAGSIAFDDGFRSCFRINGPIYIEGKKNERLAYVNGQRIWGEQ